MAAPENPFLQGNFAPIAEETVVESLDVTGELPSDLDGSYVRNGPNPQFPPRGLYHWFDGDGMLHGTRIEAGRASYRNRWIRTAGFERERREGRAIWSGLFEPPDFDNPDGPIKNTGNTALTFHDGRLLALWEAGPPHAIRVPGLETVGTHDYDGKLTFPFTAHPKVDSATGEMVFFGYGPVPPFLTMGVVSAAGELVHSEPIDLEVPVMIHDTAITARHTILLDLPLVFRLERLANGESPLVFERDRPARVGIVPRFGANADVRWFELPAFYTFHTSNAYEDGDDVVLHACRMSETDVLQGDDDANADSSTAKMHRWRFQLATGEVKEEALDDAATDFPRVNDAFIGHRNRYSYNARFTRDPSPVPIFDGIVKYDQETGAITHHEHGPGRFGGEPSFAPRPGGVDEDDGYLMTYVHDEREGTDELVVVDARDLGAPPLARVHIPVRVPYGFHGTWVPEQQIASQR